MTSLSDHKLLPTLYSGLSTPNHSPPSLNLSNHNHSPPPLPTCFSPITPSSTHPSSPNAYRNGLLRGVSDSLSRKKAGHAPVLEHILSVGHGRTLSLAADERYIYAGAQSLDNEITVFSRTSMQTTRRLLGHTGSVLALLLVKERGWLISSSSDGTVRIWSTETLLPLALINPYASTSGDVYSLAYDPRSSGTLYMGSQSTDIQYISFSSSRSPARINGSSFPKNGRVGGLNSRKFFTTPSGRSTPVPQAEAEEEVEEGCSGVGPWVDAAGEILRGSIHVGTENVVSSAHYGYIYSMLIVDRPDGSSWLFSGSGDCDVKAWKCLPGGGLEYLFSFNDLPGAVLSLATRDSLLFVGLQDGPIKIYDLESKSCIRSILAHQSDVLCLSFFGSELYSSAGDGQVLRFDKAFDCNATFQAHENAILSSVVVRNDRGGTDFVTAGREIKVWTISDSATPSHATPESSSSAAAIASTEGDVMLYALAKLVAIPSISDGAHREESRQCAHLLKKILQQLGATTSLIAPKEEGGNPLVLATFEGGGAGEEGVRKGKRKRVLFYGHYDIQPAEEKDWINDPFELTGRDGFLVGRGVADNKGPIMAVACAVAALRERRQLDVDVVMLIEGEEEAGSAGFIDAVTAHHEEIGHIDCIFLSNSSWIGESDPCVVYGMRGVIYASLTIISPNSHDAHSGVDGGTVEEPMAALNELLTEISRKGKCNIPGFYDDVQQQGEQERRTYEDLARISGTSVEALTRKWSAPTFSCSNITSSGPANKTIIPRQVTANVSFRLVPDQRVDVIANALEKFCHDTFDSFDSHMTLDVSINHKASWWLASAENCYFKAIEDAITSIWGVTPLRIREGGSIPTIPFLEHLFAAPCIHLPIGQRTSNAHLSNERLRLLNLRNGKKVVEEWLLRVGKMGDEC